MQIRCEKLSIERENSQPSQATAFAEATPGTANNAQCGRIATGYNLFHTQKLLGHSTLAVTSAYYACLTDLPELQPTRTGQAKP